jgi:hypothetical protein
MREDLLLCSSYLPLGVPNGLLFTSHQSTRLNLNLSLTGLSWPLYIGGQVLRNRSGSIHITMPVYDTDSYFDYDYSRANLAGLRGTQVTGFISYTLVSSPRDSTRIVDSGWISNLHIFISSTWSIFDFSFSLYSIKQFSLYCIARGFWLTSLTALMDWYVSNVSIIFDAPCLFLHHLHIVSLHFVALFCVFRN